jgi:Fe-Mn family superoxide dismutase
LHHDKHHRAYVDKANAALDGTDLADAPVDEVLAGLASLHADKQAAVRNNAGGHHNHSLFWESMSPIGGGDPEGDLADALVDAFGTIDAFRERFEANGVAQFGSGWTWLVVRNGELELRATPNQDSPLLIGATPLLGNDVWEHAYYLTYQNRRPEYLKAWWNVVDWETVAGRYTAARSAATVG